MNGGEYGVEWLRHAVEVDRIDEQPRVTELAIRARAQEAPQLRFPGLPPPRGLPLHGAKRAKIALRAEKLLGQRGARRADELFFQILHADMKAQPLQVGTRAGRADTGRREAPPDDVLRPGITQAGETCPCPRRAEPPQVTGERVRAAGRDDRDAFRAEAPAAAASQRFNRDLSLIPSTRTTARAPAARASAITVAWVAASGPLT